MNPNIAQWTLPNSNTGTLDTMASNVLPLFWDLASSSRDKRLGASADLVAAAQAFQAAYSAPEKASGDEDDDDEDDGDDGSESGMEVDGDDDDMEEGSGLFDPALAAKLDTALARDNAPDVVYCIKRLVRGLGSSREHSRLGFAVALTEVGSLRGGADGSCSHARKT